MGRCYSKFIDKRKYTVENDTYLTPGEITQFERKITSDVVDGGYVSCGSVRRSESPCPETGLEAAAPGDPDQDDETVPKVAGPSPCPGPRSGDLESRIAVNRALIEKLIIVEELLPYLHFIVDRNIYSNAGMCSRERAHKLLDAISDSRRKDKLDIFLDALRKLEYTYLVGRITGETADDHTHLESILRKVGAAIVDRAHVSDVMHHLYEQRVLNQGDMEQLNREQTYKGDMPACRLMLSMIPRRSPDWYPILKKILRENDMSEIADAMKDHEFEIAIEESLKDNMDQSVNIYTTNTDTGDGIDKVYEKLPPVDDSYSDTHSDGERLRGIRQELRNVIHNLKCKHRLTDEEKRLIEDLRAILHEIDTSSEGTSSNDTRFEKCSTLIGPREPDITLQVDTTDNQTTKVVVSSAASVTVKLNDERVEDVIGGIDDRCREIQDFITRSHQSLADLPAQIISRLHDGYSGHSGSCPSCARRCQMCSDSAVYTYSDVSIDTYF